MTPVVDVGLVKYTRDKAEKQRFQKLVDYFKNCDCGITFNIIIHDNDVDNMGLCKARNIILEKSKSDYVCFLDFDNHIDSIDWRAMLHKFEEDSSVGIIAPITKRCSSVKKDITWQKKEYLCCNVMLFHKRVFNKIGKFDEDFFVAYGDWDIIKRTLGNDFIILQHNQSAVTHYSFSKKNPRKGLIWRTDFKTFIKKHGEPLNRKLK
jgi:GT2 family glycosyltransferase